MCGLGAMHIKDLKNLCDVSGYVVWLEVWLRL